MTDHDKNETDVKRKKRLIKEWLEVISELQIPSRKDFDNPRLELRRLFAEILGTFFLVLVAAGGSMVNVVSKGAVGSLAVAVAPGLMVMAIILFMGNVSGAHLNPAVSISFAARGDFPWRRVPGYIVAQLFGSTLACLFLWSIFGKVGMLGQLNLQSESVIFKRC